MIINQQHFTSRFDMIFFLLSCVFEKFPRIWGKNAFSQNYWVCSRHEDSLFFRAKKSLHYFLPLAFCNYLSRLFWFSWEFLMLYLHSLCIIIQYASLFTHCKSYLQIIYIFSSIELYKRPSCFMFYGSHSTSFIYSTILCIINTLGVINLNKHWNSFSWCT